jgi:hypothetical protein
VRYSSTCGRRAVAFATEKFAMAEVAVDVMKVEVGMLAMLARA